MKNLILFVLSVFICVQGYSCDSSIYLPVSITDASRIPFRVVTNENYTLAVNIDYAPIIRAREVIARYLGRELDFFKGWEKDGEAHITTITPPNFDMFGPKLAKYLTRDDIDQIGIDHNIQGADITILGIGSTQGMVEPPNCKGCDKVESEVYFLIVESKKLIEIREAVLAKFLEKGGNHKDFNPYEFYPHITIGYTVGDVHSQPKDIRSLDNRFEIIWK